MINCRQAIGIGAGFALAFTVGLVAQPQNPPAGGAAQGRGAAQAPPPPTNLQVLPKDIPRAELLTMMRGFSTGLGVMCNYCHVQEGRGGRNDMASDEKAPKKTARVMMTMMSHANEAIASGVGKDATKVECMTCHRGEAIPKLPPPPPAPAAAPAPGH